MTLTVITFSQDTGVVEGVRRVADESYTTEDDEIVLSQSLPDRLIGRYEVDSVSNPSSLVERENYRVSEYVDRGEISESSISAYIENREKALEAADEGDAEKLQDAHLAMMDTLFKVVSGEDV